MNAFALSRLLLWFEKQRIILSVDGKSKIYLLTICLRFLLETLFPSPSQSQVKSSENQRFTNENCSINEFSLTLALLSRAETYFNDYEFLLTIHLNMKGEPF